MTPFVYHDSVVFSALGWDGGQSSVETRTDLNEVVQHRCHLVEATSPAMRDISAMATSADFEYATARFMMTSLSRGACSSDRVK